MNKDLIKTPRYNFFIGDEVLLKGKIVGFDVDENKFVENVVRLKYGQTLNVPNSAIYIADDIVDKSKIKVTIPQCVADWIEEARKTCKDVAELFEFDFTNDEVGKWFMQERPFDLVARAWLDGYEVEEEKRYIVKIKNLDSDVRVLKKRNRWYFGGDWDDARDTGLKIHTRKELEDANFGWVFDCPGIEIEEVE